MQYACSAPTPSIHLFWLIFSIPSFQVFQPVFSFPPSLPSEDTGVGRAYMKRRCTGKLGNCISFIIAQHKEWNMRETWDHSGLTLLETSPTIVTVNILYLFSNTVSRYHEFQLFASYSGFAQGNGIIVQQWLSEIISSEMSEEPLAPAPPQQQIEGKMRNLHVKLVLFQDLLKPLHEDFLALCRSDGTTIWNTSDKQLQYCLHRSWKLSVLRFQFFQTSTFSYN